jgi:hypothetical protein
MKLQPQTNSEGVIILQSSDYTMVTMGLSLASSGKVPESPELADENGFQKGLFSPYGPFTIGFLT